MTLPDRSLLRSKFFWVGLFYFAEGLPLGIFYDLFPVQFRQAGVDLRSIGALSLLGLAWTLKFLWAPAIDHWRHHRRWILAMNLAMGGALLALAAAGGAPGWVYLAIGAFTLASATNDIAIDGYTIELLDRDELGLANGLRIGFYRVGMLAAGALLILSDVMGWAGTYATSAGLLALLGVIVLRAPPERVLAAPEAPIGQELQALRRSPPALLAAGGLLLGTLWLILRQLDALSPGPSAALGGGAALLLVGAVLGLRRASRDGTLQTLRQGGLFGALFTLLDRPGILPVLAFVLLFKLADSAMGFMIKPFWVDAGFTASEIGLVSVNIGLVMSIAGGVAGGWLTDRWGIFRGLWVLGLVQALSNLGYAYVASLFAGLPPEAGIPGAWRGLMYGASMVESFTSGLGTAAFLAFLMAIVDKQRAATQYALLSSLFALSRSLAGWAGGYGAAGMGYADYFLLTFFLAFPAYLLLPWVAGMLRRTTGSATNAAPADG